MKKVDYGIYRRLALQKIKLQKIEDLDVFEELSDIDYLANLKNKVSLTSKKLFDRGLIPENFEELVAVDLERVIFIRDVFKLEPTKFGWRLKGIQKLYENFTHSSTLYDKTYIEETKDIVDAFAKVWNDLSPEILKLHSSSDWANSGNLEPFLNEIYKLENNDDFFKNTSHHLSSYIVSPTKFKNEIDKFIIEFHEDLDQWAEAYKFAKSKEPQLRQLCDQGNLDLLRKEIAKVNKFKDVAISEKKQLSLFDRLLSEKKEFKKSVKLLAEESKKYPNLDFRSFDRYKELESKSKKISTESQLLNQVLKRLIDAEAILEPYKELVSKIELRNKRKKKKSVIIKSTLSIVFLCIIGCYIFFENQRLEQEQAERKQILTSLREFWGNKYNLVQDYSLEKKKKLQELLTDEASYFGVNLKDYINGYWATTSPDSQFSGLWVHSNHFGSTHNSLRPTSIDYIKKGKKDGLSIDLNYFTKEIIRKSIFRNGDLVSVPSPKKPIRNLDPEEEKRNIVRQYQAGEISREQALERLKKLRE